MKVLNIRIGLPVFLLSILGMGVGSFELRKFAHKVENWEQFRSMKSAIPIQTFINLVELLFCLFEKYSDLILGLNTLRKSFFKKN